MQPVRANHEIWRLLRDGFAATVADSNGAEQTERFQYIRWTESDRNDFLAVNQFWVNGPLHRRRADIVLFVNGIPLTLIELKAGHRRAEDGYRDNIRDYRDAIPQLFWANGFVLVSNGSEAKVGAGFATWDHFTDWKKVESETEEGRVALETTMRATCRPDRVLDLVENFTVFQEEPGGLIKKMAKNHQYLGVNNALEALHHVGDDPGRLGVFWHTQGSGKSLSMIFFTEKVLRKRPGGWTFVIVTDRRELDRQLYGEFKAADAITGVEAQATSSARLSTIFPRPTTMRCSRRSAMSSSTTCSPPSSTTAVACTPEVDDPERPLISTRSQDLNTMPWQAFFEHLYDRFLLRDFVAKIVPGSVVLVAGLVAALDHTVDRVVTDLTNRHGAVVAVLLGVSWLMGWVAQGFRELLIERVGICIRFCQPVDWVRVVAQRTQPELNDSEKLDGSAKPDDPEKLDGSAKMAIERLTVIKEATGNFAAAIPLAGIGLHCGEQWRNEYWAPAGRDRPPLRRTMEERILGPRCHGVRTARVQVLRYEAPRTQDAGTFGARTCRGNGYKMDLG